MSASEAGPRQSLVGLSHSCTKLPLPPTLRFFAEFHAGCRRLALRELRRREGLPNQLQEAARKTVGRVEDVVEIRLRARFRSQDEARPWSQKRFQRKGRRF